MRVLSVEICKLIRATASDIRFTANVSPTGTKFRIEDIEPEIKDIADVIIDHEFRKYHFYEQSSTLLNVETFEAGDAFKPRDTQTFVKDDLT